MSRNPSYMSMRDIANTIGHHTSIHTIRLARIERAIPDPDALIGLSTDSPTCGWTQERVTAWIEQITDLTDDSRLMPRHLRLLSDQRQPWWDTQPLMLTGPMDFHRACHITRAQAIYGLKLPAAAWHGQQWAYSAVTIADRNGWTSDDTRQIIATKRWNARTDTSLQALYALADHDTDPQTRAQYRDYLRDLA